MHPKDARVAYHTIRWDDERGDFEVLEYDENHRLLTRWLKRHPRGGEPSDSRLFGADGTELKRTTYTPAPPDRAVRVVRGEHAGQACTLAATIHEHHTGNTTQRIDILAAGERKTILVDRSEVEPVD